MVVVGAGTGGTVAGIGRKLKEKLPNVKVHYFLLSQYDIVLVITKRESTHNTCFNERRKEGRKKQALSNKQQGKAKQHSTPKVGWDSNP